MSNTEYARNQASTLSISNHLSEVNWNDVVSNLNCTGSALIENFLSPGACHRTAALYTDKSLFRNRVVMEQHGYGRGEYQYFSYPLPDHVTKIRDAIYSFLVPVANRWNEMMRIETRYPKQHDTFLQRCHAAGQTRPTPLMLKYQEGDFNCLHQDLYGEHKFPLQLAILLSEPGEDFTGGEFVITEQKPRRQSKAEVIPLRQGDMLIFAVNQRPVKGSRGYYRANLRHGVSQVRNGTRYTMGIIFHDAE